MENITSRVEYSKGTCPNLDSLAERTAIICIVPVLNEEDVTDIINAIKKEAVKLQSLKH